MKHIKYIHEDAVRKSLLCCTINIYNKKKATTTSNPFSFKATNPYNNYKLQMFSLITFGFRP